jgi:L-2-hydroxyglutarate oxidase LhgO
VGEHDPLVVEPVVGESADVAVEPDRQRRSGRLSGVPAPVYDVCVIGGGIIGLATAMSVLDQLPDATVLILEKEQALAGHHSGHNSGVIHSGIYYQPGTLKAELCRAGSRATYAFCAAHDIPVRPLGKLPR